MPSKVNVFPEKEISLKFLKDLLEIFKYEVEEDGKELIVYSKEFIPFFVRYSKRQSQIVFSIIIDIRNEVEELNLAKFVRNLNDKSTYCNFNYRYSKTKGNKLGATATMLTFNGMCGDHIYYLSDRFGREFLKTCFSKEAKKFCYFKRGKLLAICPDV